MKIILDRSPKWVWKAHWTKILYDRIRLPFWKLRTKIQWDVTGDCGNFCGYAPRFGQFVPEAGCPIHDIEESFDEME